MHLMKKHNEIRQDIATAIRLADEMRDISRVYREALETIFNDDAIPREIREQYERLVIAQLRLLGAF